ncbi:MAG: protein kinase [Labilithrix sp.]|nr:protein kinase [Labilithrix sp.]
MVAPSEIPPDTLLGGRYRLLHRIGRGGMGDVWMARNEATGAEVAIKTLARSDRTPVHEERFRREARLAATISHRNVVRIFDLVEDDDGTLALVMELLRGGTLEACIKERGALSGIHACAVAIPILSALHHVHEKGIVHRDVKPTNIFFAVEPDGLVVPKILDFGIAKLPAATTALTVDGTVLGTPHYMSPEQIRGIELDGRSDMFSLATVLYEMLTATSPFQRDAAPACLAAVLEHELDPDPRIEPRVWIALSRALSKRPYERPPTCAAFATALQDAIGASDEELAQSLRALRPRSDSIPPPPLGAAEPASGRRPRRPRADKPAPWKTLAIAGAAAVVAVTATLALTRSPSSGATPLSEASASRTEPAAPPSATSATVAPVASASSAASAPTAQEPAILDELAPVSSTSPSARPASVSRPHGPRGASSARGASAKPLATAPDF